MTPTENVGNATEALGRAMADAACDCEPRQHEPNPLDVAANLEALGWKVVPIDHFVGDDCTEEDIAHFAALQQAEEAADEMGGHFGPCCYGSDHQAAEAADVGTGHDIPPTAYPDDFPSAAVAPLDVEALREQVYYLLFIYGQMDAEHGHWAAVRRMLNIDAAYADAIRKRGGA